MNQLKQDPLNANRALLTYLETPCMHKFHASCLLDWMRVKLECPLCRKQIPQYQDC